ncbi:MAG: nicotinate-nucleotide adenylyltransferase [Aerococcus sp.]|nr:nicotinate-nucleotide adenylyltransferase [Aerococcus sp.]
MPKWSNQAANAVTFAPETKRQTTEHRHRVGILGGTFNPVHNGHLVIAEQVRDKLGLERVYFMPDYQPPHVDEKSAIDYRYRVAMLCLALNQNLQFDIEMAEIERQGKSYTYDTMKMLVEAHPDTDYYFIIGADMVEYLPKWYKIDELLKLVHFVGVKREGYSLTTDYPVITVDVPEIAISSSQIRSAIQHGNSVRYLVPEPVYYFIEKEGLYRD